MHTIKLQILINADLASCFDTSRSIDVHVNSMANSKEKAIAGTTTGLVPLAIYAGLKRESIFSARTVDEQKYYSF